MKNIRITGIEAPVMNREKADAYLKPLDENLGRMEADVVLFPEKWISNVFVDGSESHKKIMKKFSGLSSDHGICIVPGSLNIQRKTGLFNSSPVFYKGELLGWQDKIVPFRIERNYYSPGSEINVFQVDNYRIGVQVCYDLDFPFITKMQAEQGVDVILNPSLIVKEFHNMWHLYVKTRSLENRIPVISVNSTSDPFGGSSISTYFSVREKGVLLRTRRSRDSRVECSVSMKTVRGLSKQRRREDPGGYSLNSGK